MNTDLKIRQAKLSRWAALFQEQASSGLTIKDWCIQNDVSIHAFYCELLTVLTLKAPF